MVEFFNGASVEDLVDKMGYTVWEMMFMKLVLFFYHNRIHSYRQQRGLSDFVDRINNYYGEYSSRFPALIITSPDFYPEAHSSTEHVYIGGLEVELGEAQNTNMNPKIWH